MPWIASLIDLTITSREVPLRATLAVGFHRLVGASLAAP